MLHPISRHRINKYLKHGYSESYSGKAANIYKALIRHFKLPIGHFHTSGTPSEISTFHWYATVTSDDPVKLKELKTTLFLSLPNATSNTNYWRDKEVDSFHLRGKVQGETTREVVKESFNMAFKEIYNDEIGVKLAAAVKAVNDGHVITTEINL